MIFKKNEVVGTMEDWKKEAYGDFSGDLSNKSPKFPCIFGSMGLKDDMLRFGFYEDTEDENLKLLATDLKEYLKECRKLGAYTSYATFFNISRDLDERSYEDLFWIVLNKLHAIDSEPWPEKISHDPENHTWEFCFHGEPIFVVCNTPAHRERASRSAKYFMITFQPRWVFDAIELNTLQGDKYKKTIRKLLEKYDNEEEYPHLGAYGHKENLEYKQYFIPDSNQNIPESCPFHSLVKERDEIKEKQEKAHEKAFV